MTKKIIVEIAEGLGNQLFMYAHAFSMSKKLGYELLIDNKSAYSKKKNTLRKHQKYMLDSFNIVQNYASNDFIYDKLHKKIKKKLLILIDKFSNKQVFFREKSIKKNNSKIVRNYKNLSEINFSDNIYVQGNFENYEYFNEFKNEISNFFIAKNELNGRKGAIIGLDPSTGLVKVLVSSPDFNPNLFNGTSSSGELSSLLTDKESPLFNRVISGNYPPASTLKPFIGLLALENKIIDWDYSIDDKGFFQIEGEGRKYRGWKEGGHGEVNLKKAIAVSSDVFFYQLATSLTIDRLSNFLEQFGFGLISGIDLDNESSANLPTRNWKLGAVGESWFVGDTVNLGIGQGYITITPMQLALATSVIVNKGIAYKPRIVERINQNETDKEILYEVKIQDKSHWDGLQDAMEAVTNSWYGTAYNLSLSGENKIAGKTGTAQIKSLTEEGLSVREEYEEIRESISDRDHALFVGYGPIQEPKLVMVVIVENGESGSSVAAPIAQKIIDTYLRESP